MSIRLASLNDVEQVRYIGDGNFPQFYTRQQLDSMVTDTNKFLFLLLIYNNDIAGFIIGRHDSQQHFHLMMFCIEIRYRKQGLGKYFYNYLEDIVRSRNYIFISFMNKYPLFIICTILYL